MVGLLFIPLVFNSCEDKMDEHYKIPDWIKGNAFEVLQAEGNYTIFLAGVEKAGFKPIVNGKGILTVMAPNDSAFTAYLNGKNYSSIDDMSLTDLRKLIGFHLVYYAFDWNKFVNFRPMEGDGATEEDKASLAGLFYKYRTKSSDAITREYNPATGDTVSVYHLERFLPVFSYKLFETFGIDASYNYEYFYPNSTWTGGSNGFNVSNASVVNTENVISNNGYVYFINQVLEPLETIYTELKNHYGEYSLFFDLYNSNSTYTIDNELTKNFGNGDTLYLHGHGVLPPIAYEWPISNYQAIGPLSLQCYNVFAPTNNALNTFFDAFWKVGGYATLADLDPLILKYFLIQSFSRNSTPVFPEQISQGWILTTLETPININPEDVTLRQMCVNGTLYGMNRMTAPAIFTSVAGPAFKYFRYRNFLYALDGSNLLLALASQETRFITLMPDTSQFTNENMRLANLATGSVLQKFSDEAGVYVNLTSDEMTNMVNTHICNVDAELVSIGSQVLETNIPFNYWYVHDGKITTNVLFNQYLNPDFAGDPFVAFTELQNGTESWSNGKSYTYAHTGLFKADESDGLEYALAICNDARYPYYLFSQLLQKAGLINGNLITSLPKPTSSDDVIRFITFIPSNDAIKNKLDSIPGASTLSVSGDGSITGTISSSNKTKLANWLRSFFITSDLNTFTVYPYPGADLKGVFDTYGSNKMTIIDGGANVPLCVEFKDGVKKSVRVVSTYYYLPFAYKDGCFHLIEDILL
jgi:hypothetical protein